LLSPQFTFLLGENREPVTVHAGVISALSEPFDRLINGPMKEAQEKCAELPHIDRDVFLGLVEYAYRGNYTVPSCEIDPEVEHNSDDDAFDNEICNVERTRHLEWPAPEYYPTRRECFDKKPPAVLPDNPFPNTAASVPSVQHVGDRNLEHKDVFLFNAKMFCLADYYINPALKTLALHKLHEVLKQCMDFHFILDPWRVEDVVALIAYAYNNENTPDHSSVAERDPLREEVLGYVMTHLADLELHPAFKELLSSEGQLSIDVISCLLEERSAEAKRAEATGHYGKSFVATPVWSRAERLKSMGLVG
jgi:hypothetical protein